MGDYPTPQPCGPATEVGGSVEVSLESILRSRVPSSPLPLRIS